MIYQDSGAFVAGPAPLQAAASTGNSSIEPGTSLYVHGYSGGAQTHWLQRTLSGASTDHTIDWIIVQMHQDALSSSQNGNGSDKGIRESWLPLFDRYGVDLVLCGHDHDYERSWPVRGCNRNVGRDATTGTTEDTCQPAPVMTADPADGKFDTSAGCGRVPLSLAAADIHLVGAFAMSARMSVCQCRPRSEGQAMNGKGRWVDIANFFSKVASA